MKKSDFWEVKKVKKVKKSKNFYLRFLIIRVWSAEIFPNDLTYIPGIHAPCFNIWNFFWIFSIFFNFRTKFGKRKG